MLIMKKNPKGTNYWRNRFVKVSQDIKQSSGKDLNFAISNSQSMHDVQDFGFDVSDINKIHIGAYDESGKKYRMTTDFSLDS